MKRTWIILFLAVMLSGCGNNGNDSGATPEAEQKVVTIDSVSIVFDPVTKTATNPCRATISNTGNTDFAYLFLEFHWNSTRYTNSTTLTVGETKEVMPSANIYVTRLSGYQECYLRIYEESFSNCTGPGCPPLPPLLASKFTSTVI